MLYRFRARLRRRLGFRIYLLIELLKWCLGALLLRTCIIKRAAVRLLGYRGLPRGHNRRSPWAIWRFLWRLLWLLSYLIFRSGAWCRRLFPGIAGDQHHYCGRQSQVEHPSPAGVD